MTATTQTATRKPTLAALFANHMHSFEGCPSGKVLFEGHRKLVDSMTGNGFSSESGLYVALKLHQEGIQSQQYSQLAQAGLIDEKGELTDRGGFTLFYMEHPLEGEAQEAGVDLEDFIARVKTPPANRTADQTFPRKFTVLEQ
jgi:hypothetical protein